VEIWFDQLFKRVSYEETKLMLIPHRHCILLNYAAWTATAAFRSGKHIKDGKTLQNSLEAVIKLHEIPSTQEKFDKWHERVTCDLETKVKDLRSESDKKKSGSEEIDTLDFNIGWSAKLLNIYLKTLYYVGDTDPKAIRKYVHPPIDNILLDAIFQEYGVPMWTGDKNFTIQGIENYKEYAGIIDRMKLVAKEAGLENLMDIEHVWKSVGVKSSQKEKFKLHEAMEEVLNDLPNNQGTYSEVARIINERKLYERKDNQEVPAFQIKLRATLSNGKYAENFKAVGDDGLRLIKPLHS
jgi:hypothetical protein